MEALDLGAVDYLRKPCDVDELVARVRAGLRVKAPADELRRVAADLDTLGSTDAATGLATLTVEVARRLRSTVRPGQLLGRWGGEEFLAVALGLAGDLAHRYGERLPTIVGWEPVQTTVRR